jgi:hypothetical protein
MLVSFLLTDYAILTINQFTPGPRKSNYSLVKRQSQAWQTNKEDEPEYIGDLSCSVSNQHSRLLF